MPLTHALSTNNYGESKFIVSSSLANGTHVTLSAAMSDAVSGDTIFMRSSVTENVTITPGVNITAWTGSGDTPVVSIIGTLTMTGAGTSTISNIRLQTNSAPFLTVSGSAASIVNLRNCYLNCTNNTGISFTTANASAQIVCTGCNGDIGTTGITLFSDSSTGGHQHIRCFYLNSGASTTASTKSAGNMLIFDSFFNHSITTSSTSIITFENSSFELLGTTSLTHNSAGANSSVIKCFFNSGNASAISIGTGAVLVVCDCVVSSSNTNAVTGLGTIRNGGIFFPNSSSLINTTTQLPFYLDVGGISFDGGTNTLANYATGTFTPTAIGGSVAGTTTYTVQQGYYTRIGNMVTVWGNIQASAATGTGDITIGGFPFTIKNQSNYTPIGTIISFSGPTIAFPAGSTYLNIDGTLNSITAVIRGSGSTVSGGNLQMANTTLGFIFTLTYQI